jgi:beta propeller repeat protein
LLPLVKLITHTEIALDELTDRWAAFAVSPGIDDQELPDVHNDIIVWQDNRDGNWQIYAVLLDGPEIAQCLSRPEGDVNGDCKIDFADQALMASNWLECGLDPQEACPPG